MNQLLLKRQYLPRRRVSISGHAFVAAALLGVGATAAHAEFSLTSTTYSQNFNSLGTSATATLPTGWLLSAAGAASPTYSSGLTTTQIQASSGSPATGGRYNWGNGADTTDRSVGFLTSSGYASPNSVMFGLTNSTGGTITSLSLSYDYERYRINTAAAAVTLFGSTDGINWIAITAGDSGAFSTGTSAYTFTGGTVVSKSPTINGLSIASGATYYLRWNFNTTGSNSQGLGLDNFTLSATTAVGGSVLYWVGADTSRGGDGIWASSGGTVWATTDADVAGGAWDSSKTASFGGAVSPSVVTVDGSVDAGAGVSFTSDGYTVSGGTVNLTGANAAANTVSVSNASTAIISAPLVATNGMTKSGTGTLVVTGSSSGDTTIAGGVLQIGNGGTTGSLSGNVIDNATFAFNRSDSYTFSGAISGTGTVQQNGPGTTVLTGTNTYGTTTIASGTLQVGAGGTTGTLGSGAVTNNANLAFNRSDTITVANTISGTGSVQQTGPGTTILTANNSYTNTTVTNGTLQVGSGGTTGTVGSGPVTNNATLAFNRSDSSTVSNSISGTGSVSQIGIGTTVLTGSNSYGATSITAGILQVGSGGTTGTLGAGTVTNNATLAVNRSDSITIGNTITGSGVVRQTGAGTTTLAGNNDYSGGTMVSAGTLVAGSSTALGSGAVTVTGATLLAAGGTTLANPITINGAAGAVNLVAGWDFQTTTNGGSQILASPNTQNQLIANFGTGTLYLNGANGSSNWAGTNLDAFTGSTIGGGGGQFSVSNSGASSLALLNGTTSTNGQSAVFKVSMAGLSNLSVSYDTRYSSNQAFTTQTWEYSADGASWTNFATNTTLSTSFQTITLGTTSGLDGAPNAYLRLTVSGAASASSNNRFDNFAINAATPGTGGVVGSDITSGTATFGGAVSLNSAGRLTAAAGGTSEFTGVISNGANGAKGIEKIGLGVVKLSNSNGFTGGTTVTAGTLEAGAAGALGQTSGITVETGGTLLLSGTGDRVNDLAGVTLHGGAIKTGGLSEDLGTLTLSGDSTIDFGDSNISSLNFAGGSWTAGTLNILNWNARPEDTTQDMLHFTPNQVSQTFLDHISFDGYGAGEVQFNTDSGYFQVVPVPEPTTILGALALVGLVGYRERRRLAVLRSLFVKPEVLG